MKPYGKKDNCWCDGPPYEKCELCCPNREEKRHLKKKIRQRVKKEIKKELNDER